MFKRNWQLMVVGAIGATFYLIAFLPHWWAGTGCVVLATMIAIATIVNYG